MNTEQKPKRYGHSQSPLSRAAAIRNWKLKQLACVVAILRKDLNMPHAASDLDRRKKLMIELEWTLDRNKIKEQPTFMPRWR